jgi:hypothetical protein
VNTRSIDVRVVALCLAAALSAGGLTAALGACGPFTDVTDGLFCPFVLEIFYLGITTGTTPTTYDPAGTVTRLQMAAFLSRTVDSVLKRGGPRAAIGKFWVPQDSSVLALTTVGIGPTLMRSDGADVWAATFSPGMISRVRAKDGRLLETWTGATSAYGILIAMGRVLATGYTNPGSLYLLDPTKPAGAVTLASTVGAHPTGIAFDGSRVWTANFAPGAVSIVTPSPSVPWPATTVSTGFQALAGALYDGNSVWVTDYFANTLLKLDGAGAVLQTVTVGVAPSYPIFDGSNIWVPNTGNTLTVVRAASGAVLATLTGNGLDSPTAAAFDGQRVLITNNTGDSVSLWKAADLTPIGFLSTGSSTQPVGACADGVNFWIGLNSGFAIARF